MNEVTNQPIAQSQRLVNIDIIRGIALLGILIMNIQSFSMIFSAYSNPTVYGDLTGANYYVYYLSHLFADQKFISIFSFLFGVGIILMADNIEKKEGNPARIHYKRMFILLCFGLAHAYLLWYGDILSAYAIGGMIAYLAKDKSPRFLITTGIVLIGLCALLMLAIGVSLNKWPQDELNKLLVFWQPTQALIEQDLQNYQSSWFEQMDTRITTANEMIGNMAFYLPRVIGLMLIGIACYKMDFFGDRFNSKSLVISGSSSLVLGVFLITQGIHYNFSSGWQLESMFIGSQFNYWGSILVSYSYLALLVVLCRCNLFTTIKQALANVGKMALTNYLSHTLLCTFIFYGWGLGLFGQVERIEQILIVFAIWGFQLWFSHFWLSHYRYGPFEWLWRSLTYARLQPLKNHRPSSTAG